MSRTPPFPSRRPSVTNGVSYIPSSAPGTSTIRPLQISRTGSRPTSPVYTSYPPNTAPLGPSRPRRSELRARVEYSEPERASISSDPYRDRDSTSTSRSDYPSTSYRVPPKSANTSTTMGSRSKQQGLDGDQTIPPSLSSSFSAFRSAGSSKGQHPDEVEDNYQRDRELEIEAEKARQQRIRDKGLAKGNARRGEIDGMFIVLEPNCNL
jgi:exocyst complex component 4